MTSSRGHRTVGYEDDHSSDDGYGDHKSTRSRGHRPRAYRNDSLIKKDDAELDKGDSGWDTDYSPRDKYYLSESDDPHGIYSPRRSSSEKKTLSREHSKERRSPAKHHPTDHRSSSRRSPSPARTAKSHSHRHRRQLSRSRSRSRSHSRERGEGKSASTSRHHKSSHAHKKPTSSTTYTPRSRPKPSRAPSSYHHTSARPRPRPTRAASSYTAASLSRSTPRPRPVRGLSRNASHTHTTKTRFPRDLTKLMDPDTLKALMKDFPWDEAGKVALQAGTVAAIKVGTDSIPWPVKATKIGSAALGAAVVDHVFKPKKKGGIKYTAMRHLAEVAVGSLVVGPAMGKADHKVQSRRSGGGKR